MTASAASTAWALDRPTTTATGSPTNRTRSRARGGRANSGPRSPAASGARFRSPATNTPSTPGRLLAALVSMSRILAWAMYERTNAACRASGVTRSSTKRASPVSRGASSLLRWEEPTREFVMGRQASSAATLGSVRCSVGSPHLPSGGAADEIEGGEAVAGYPVGVVHHHFPRPRRDPESTEGSDRLVQGGRLAVGDGQAVRQLRAVPLALAHAERQRAGVDQLGDGPPVVLHQSRVEGQRHPSGFGPGPAPEGERVVGIGAPVAPAVHETDSRSRDRAVASGESMRGALGAARRGGRGDAPPRGDRAGGYSRKGQHEARDGSRPPPSNPPG